jgi:uncharacterized iron-regulated membrane protein
VPVNKTRAWLRKYHIWLGWVVALPMLAWTVSGLVMVLRPIEQVRGEHLLGPAPVLQTGAVPVPPQIGPRPVASLLLEQRSDGPKWVIRYADGGTRLADATTGRLLPRLNAAQAAKAVTDRYAGEATIKSVGFVSGENPPIDLRRKVDGWRVTMDDGTRFYVNAATGEIVARRTAFWRVYDFMWGLHIMDLKTREDTSNPLVIGFGIVTLVTTTLAIALLPWRRRKKKRS